MVRLEQIADVAREFVLVRLVRITGMDLRLFEFDYDLTWAAFLLNADEKIYGRYGSRDASGPDSRNSLAGLRYSMEAALAAHRREPPGQTYPPRPGKPLRAEDYPAARAQGRGCIHCHQVNEFRRQALQAEGRWQRDEVWSYPLPENIGITLDRDAGDRIVAVRPATPAARAGMRTGDRLRTLNGVAIASLADVQYALHRAPTAGQIPATWEHGPAPHAGELLLEAGWRRTNITWRPSLLDLLPSLPVHGEDLTAAEKQQLGLGPKQLAFRQEFPVLREARAAGVEVGDIILGIDGREFEMTAVEFSAHVRTNYQVGDRVAIRLLRKGQRLDLPVKLR